MDTKTEKHEPTKTIQKQWNLALEENIFFLLYAGD